MDYVALCENFVATNFPAATIAVMAGSTARGTRTTTSDIDLLLIGDELFDDQRTSLAGTYQFGGEAFEVFAYTNEAFEQWTHGGLAQYRPVIVEMLFEGRGVRGGADLAALRHRWQKTLDAGPVIDAHELAMRRYVITDLLDDLQDSTDQLEQHVIAATLFDRAAELILLTNRHWVGTGKYLPRRLRAFSEDIADELSAPLLSGDLRAFSDEVGLWLDRAGGRVHTGFIR